MSRHLFLSIRPEFTDKILQGVKRAEFRRTRPRVEPGHPVILYASSPVMGIVGFAQVKRVVSGSPTRLWNLFREEGGIDRARFRDYFKGASGAHAITLTGVEPLDETLDLARIRSALPGFNPPQAFVYMTSGQVARLGLDAVGRSPNG